MRAFAGVVAGVVVFIATVLGNELLSVFVHPVPAGVDLTDPTQQDAYVRTLPASAFAVVLVGWGLGSVFGAAAGRAVGRSVAPAVGVAAIGTASAVLNNASMPSQPAWMWAGVLLFAPLAWLGDRLARR
jgi:hypothetical protein